MDKENMEDILSALEASAARLYSENKYKMVEEMFSTFIKESETLPGKTRARAFNNRGHAKYMQVDFPAASQDYNEAINLNPDCAVAYYNRAQIAFRMGQFKEAMPDFEKACQLQPDHPEFVQAKEQCSQSLSSADAAD